MTSLAPTVAVGQGYDLRLMSSVNDVSGIPTEGKSLIIVAAVKNVLHFRIFDRDGQMVVDTDETKLTKQAGPIEDLRKQLESLWPPHGLTESEKDRVIAAVTSILRVPTRLNVMRLGLIADIHADIRALEKALLGLEAHGVDQIPLGPGTWSASGTSPMPSVALIRDRAMPLHPRQPRPLGHRAASNARDCGAGKRLTCVTTPWTSWAACRPAAGLNVKLWGSSSCTTDSPPAILSTYSPTSHCLRRSSNSGTRTTQEFSYSAAHRIPSGSTGAPRHDHQPRLGLERAGSPDLLQLRHRRSRSGRPLGADLRHPHRPPRSTAIRSCITMS